MTLNLSDFIIPTWIPQDTSIQKKQYILYGCFSDVGAVGKNFFQGKERSLYYSPIFLKENIKLFINGLVDKDHLFYQTNNQSVIIGKVLDAWINESGYTTLEGNYIPPDNLPHCKLECNLTDSERKQIQGFSCFFTPIVEQSQEPINNINDCDIKVIGIDTSEAIGISVCVDSTPRMTSTRVVFNSIENDKLSEKEKKLDNNNDTTLLQNNMTEEEKKTFIEEMKSFVISEIAKQIKEATERTPKVENAEDTPASEPTSEIAQLKSEIAQLSKKFDEVTSLLAKAIEMKTVENSADTPATEPKKDSIANSLNLTNKNFTIIND